MDKPKVSVIIPNKDDTYLLDTVISRLNDGINKDDVEIIVVDDGSSEPPPTSLTDKHSNLKVYYKKTQQGVGYSFDYGVKRAEGNIIFLCGSDVLVKDKGWLDAVIHNAKEHPKSFTCATCVGLHDKEDVDKWEMRIKRYGSDIMFKMSEEDLPPGSKLRELDDFADILQCKWILKKREESSYEIPAILGTSYAVSKRWYKHIGGWGYIKGDKSLNKEEIKFKGHRVWGGLEPMISIKSWFAGGSCRVDPQWETGHIFGRNEHVRKSRAIREDMYYFNKLFIANTLLSKSQAEALDTHLLRKRNENLARRYIQRNKKAVMWEKQFNDSLKRDDITLFIDKFGYDLDWLK